MDPLRIFIKFACLLGICFYSTEAQKSLWLTEIVDTFKSVPGTLFLGSNITNITSITPKCWSDFQFYLAVLNNSPTPIFTNQSVPREIIYMLDADAVPPAGITSGKGFWNGDYDLCMSLKVDNKVFNYTEYTEDGIPRRDVSLRANFKAQYYRVVIHALDGIGFIEGYQNFTITFGVCAPDSCSSSDVHTMLNDGERSFDVASVENPTSGRGFIKDDPGAIVALWIISIFVAIVLAATLIDMFYITLQRKRHKRDAELYKETTTKGAKVNHAYGDSNDKHGTQATRFTTENQINGSYYTQKGDDDRKEHSVINGADNGSLKIVTSDALKDDAATNGLSNGSLKIATADVPNHKPKPYSPGVGIQIILAFSVYSNLPQLMSVDAPKGSYLALNCIRFLSMVYILLGHTFQIGIYIGVSGQSLENYNFWLLPVYQGQYNNRALTNSQLAVDSFFVLSGFLGAVSFLKTLDRQGGKLRLKQMGLYFFHRFWRLTPVYMIVLMFFATLFKYTGDGPLWPVRQDQIEGCRMHWWTNLLYINNLYLPGPLCLGYTWYLANDMQFYIVAPVFLFALFKKPVVGYILTGLTFLGSIIAISVLHFQGNADYVQYYIKPYTRIGPYIIGIWLGYFIWRTKGKIKMKWWMQAIGWIFAIGFIHAAIYGNFRPLGTPFEGVPAAFYIMFKRHIFGLAVAWICLACITGYGGVVNKLMSWRVWIPLSKLTYTGYLIHPMVMYYYHYNRRQLQYMRIFPEMVFLFCAILCATIAASILVTLTFEIPVLHLEKIMFPQNKKNK